MAQAAYSASACRSQCSQCHVGKMCTRSLDRHHHSRRLARAGSCRRIEEEAEAAALEAEMAARAEAVTVGAVRSRVDHSRRSLCRTYTR